MPLQYLLAQAPLEPIQLLKADPASTPTAAPFPQTGLLVAGAVLATLLIIWAARRMALARNPADAAWKRMAKHLRLSGRAEKSIRAEAAARSLHPIALLFASPAAAAQPIAAAADPDRSATRKAIARSIIQALSTPQRPR